VNVKNILFTILGCVFLAVGAVGVAVPVLPTTPFVLLAAFFFYSGNKKLHIWLKQNRVFGQYIENYQTKRGISLKLKISSIAFLWTGLIISAAIVQTPWVYVTLAVVGAGVTAHLLMIKTKNKV
jgi:uncharacterized membrane protein YbaN (DUF454 family)